MIPEYSSQRVPSENRLAERCRRIFCAQMDQFEQQVGENIVLILAYSGGVDSTALMHLLSERYVHAAVSGSDTGALGQRIRPILISAHFDHGWRPQNDAGEEAFCHEVSQRCGFSYISMTVNEMQEPRRLREAIARFWTHHRYPLNDQDLQEITERLPGTALGETRARQYRYAFFSLLVRCLEQQYGRQAYVLTAHQADDQAETLLMNLSRGCSMSGAAGIPQFRDSFYRPLLQVSREEIAAYLEVGAHKFLTDASNTEAITLRNRLRNELLPELATMARQPELIRHLADFCSSVASYRDSVRQSIQDFLQKQLFEITGICMVIPLREARQLDAAQREELWREIFGRLCSTTQNLAATHIADLENALNGRQSAARVSYKGCHIYSDRQSLRVWRHRPQCPRRNVYIDWPFVGGKTARILLLAEETKNVRICFSRASAYDLFSEQDQLMPADSGSKTHAGSRVVHAPQVGYNHEVFKDQIAELDGLVWRRRRGGDYVVLRQGSHKALRVFMIERNIPTELRASLALLAQDSEILELPGFFKR